MPGIGTDFVFIGGGTLNQHADGSAILKGRLRSTTNSFKRLDAAVTLTARLNPGDPGHAPEGSPKMELKSAAGQGALIQISRVGPSFQVGLGASGKNVAYGASGWLGVVVLQQPASGPALVPTSHGDINIDLFDCP